MKKEKKYQEEKGKSGPGFRNIKSGLPPAESWESSACIYSGGVGSIVLYVTQREEREKEPRRLCWKKRKKILFFSPYFLFSPPDGRYIPRVVLHTHTRHEKKEKKKTEKYPPSHFLDGAPPAQPFSRHQELRHRKPRRHSRFDFTLSTDVRTFFPSAGVLLAQQQHTTTNTQHTKFCRSVGLGSTFRPVSQTSPTHLLSLHFDCVCVSVCARRTCAYFLIQSVTSSFHPHF